MTNIFVFSGTFRKIFVFTGTLRKIFDFTGTFRKIFVFTGTFRKSAKARGWRECSRSISTKTRRAPEKGELSLPAEVDPLQRREEKVRAANHRGNPSRKAERRKVGRRKKSDERKSSLFTHKQTNKHTHTHT